MITNDQWQKYLAKYENLMWKISHTISGDRVTANLEDNFADLCVSALESIYGFEKKTGTSFDEFIDTDLFNSYTKTVLWNSKNKKGKLLTKKKNKLRRINFTDLANHLNSDIPAEKQIENMVGEDRRSNFLSEIITKDLFSKVDTYVTEVVTTLSEGKDLKSSKGNISVSKLAETTGLPKRKVVSAIHEIEKIIKKSNDEPRY